MIVPLLGMTNYQGSPTHGTLRVEYLSRLEDGLGNATPGVLDFYAAPADLSAGVWRDDFNRGTAGAIIVNDPGVRPVEMRLTERFFYEDGRVAEATYKRLSAPTNLAGTEHDYTEPQSPALWASAGLPLTFQTAANLIVTGGAVLTQVGGRLGELDTVLADIEQSTAAANLAINTLNVTSATGQVVANYAAVSAAWAALPVGQALTDAVMQDVYPKTASGQALVDSPKFNLKDNSVDTIAVLRVYPISRPNVTVRVRGYYAAGDGGGGVYRWRPGGRLPDDGGMYLWHSTNTSGFWEYQAEVPGVINAAVYGALPVNDAAKGGVRINAAIQGAKARWERGTILLTCALSAYYVDVSVKWIPGFTIRGASADSTAGARLTLAPGAPAGTHVIESTTWANGKIGIDWMHYARLENLVVDGNKANNPNGGYGIAVWQMGETAVIKDLLVKNCKSSNIRTEGVHAPHRIENVTSNSSDGYGFDLNGGGACVMSLEKPSGDNNAAGFINLTGSMSMLITSLKAERQSGHDPIVNVNLTNECFVHILGGYANSNAALNDLIKISGGVAPQIIVEGLRQQQYTNIINDTVNGKVIPVLGTINTLMYRVKDHHMGAGADILLDYSIALKSKSSGGTEFDLLKVDAAGTNLRAADGGGIRLKDNTGATVFQSKGTVIWAKSQLRLGGTDADSQAATVYANTGSPEGVLSSKKGSLYIRTDGGTGSTLYVKETDNAGAANNTGWVAK